MNRNQYLTVYIIARSTHIDNLLKHYITTYNSNKKPSCR